MKNSTNNHNQNMNIEISDEKGKQDSQKNKFWRSLNILQNYNSPEVIKTKKNEFEEGATDEIDLDGMSENSRRKFLALMGASGAFALAACSDYQDKGEIIPYNKKPNSVIPGIPNFYASTLTATGRPYGVLIKTREGRPIKVDGNSEHPINKGKINTIGHSAVLNLYDPGRITNPKIKADKNSPSDNLKSNWAEVDKTVVDALNSASSKGKEIAILMHKYYSPTATKVINDFKAKYPTTVVYSYEVFNDNHKQNAWQKMYGNGTFPVINYDKARVIVSLDSDFIDSDGDSIENVIKYSSTRNVDDLENFSRLYSIEAVMSLTGANADYRMRLTPELQYDLAMSLASEIVKKGAAQINIDADVMSKLNSFNLAKFAESNGFDQKIIDLMVNDLITNRGRGIVVAGFQLSENVHMAVNLLNEILSNTALYDSSKDLSENTLNSWKDLSSLSSKMTSGAVAVLINFDTNPIYNLPDDCAFEAAMDQVPLVISMTELENETTAKSNIILPINHDFESWGDFKPRTGVVSLQQPVIAPLYNSRQKEAILLNWTGDTSKYSDNLYHNYLMNRWQNEVFPMMDVSSSFSEFWFASLHDGVITFNEASAPLSFNASSILETKSSPAKSGFTVVLQPAHSIGDGRFANNGWLQEMPHPINKVTWDNFAAIAPKTAIKMSLKYNDVIEVEVSGRKVKLPVMLSPGMAEDVVAVMLGYGRTHGGVIGTGIGFDASVLMSKDGGISQYVYTGANVVKTSETYELISTQEHHVLDDFLTKKDGTLNDFHKVREIIQEANVDQYAKDPKILKHHEHEIFSLYSDVQYNDVKWSMAIDMSKCFGCNLCNVACYAENNIPTVGKDQVAVGREMGWIRTDRYYNGNYENPTVSVQPILCQHCDNAPCENVCPVVATTHSPDGLNQMVYNRCVGTRYCANNCPFKVRRFNFFDFRDKVASGYYKGGSADLVHNPEVTIRARGTMEKCTFCVQRIMESRQHSREEGKVFDGSDVRTACQDACPANAITFGNSNDPNSAVSKLRAHNLGYHVLEALNVKPNVTYIAKLRNVVSEGDNSEHH